MSIANNPVHPTPANLMTSCEQGAVTAFHHAGMTLRQHYVGLVMRSLLESSPIDMPLPNAETFASVCVEYADAVCAALEE